MLTKFQQAIKKYIDDRDDNFYDTDDKIKCIAMHFDMSMHDVKAHLDIIYGGKNAQTNMAEIRTESG